MALPGADAGAPILVVEDDPDLRLTIEWTLEDEGLAVSVAPDGRTALALAERARPTVVLLDIGLPDIDGYGVAAGLRARYGAELPIVVMTADGAAAEKARRVGAVDYVHKPFDVAELVARVRRAAGEPPATA